MKKIIYIFLRIIYTIGLIAVIFYLYVFSSYIISIIKEKITSGEKYILTNGNLLYIGDSCCDLKLYLLDLSSNKNEVKKFFESKYEDSGSPKAISKMDSENLLIDVYKNAMHKIYKFNIKTKKMSFLREGSHPVYMPKHKKLLFLLNLGWNHYKKKADGGLFVVDIDDLTNTKFIMETETQFNHIMPISDSEVIFRGERREDWFIYDIKTDKTTPLPIKDFRPALWRKKTQQLLGYSKWKEGEHLISLDSKRIERITLPGSPIMYIPEKDMVVFIKKSPHLWFRADIRYDLYVYDFATNKSELLNNGKENGFGLEKGVFIQQNDLGCGG